LRALLTTNSFILCGLLTLTACTDREGDLGSPAMSQRQPVELLLSEDGRPEPSVLADEQVVRRGNGEEPETLDPHRAVGVPSSHILRDLFEGLTA
jgi:oligopeptide transport system substrate-binding protein